jgi:hypothetical protein
MADAEWRPGVNEATCLADRPQPCSSVPGAGCCCGWWALWSPARCWELVRRRRLFWRAPVLGLVAGWGAVALHGAEGFRAQRASVLAVFDHPLWESRSPLDRLANRYGVPALWLRTALEAGVLAEFGASPGSIAEVRAALAGVTDRPGRRGRRGR